MTDIRQNQFAITGAVQGTAPLRVNQLVAVSVAYIPSFAPMQNSQLALAAVTNQPVDLRLNQIAIVLAVSPNSEVISPNRAIGLECWQPCLSYGTNALVYWKGSR